MASTCPHSRPRSQAQVEARIAELAGSASQKLAVDRRRFLAGSGGMAAAFIAMNEVFGRFFDVDLVEMFEPVAYAQSGTPRDLFVFDDQLHMVRGSERSGGAGLRALAQGPSAAPAFQDESDTIPKSFPTSAARSGAFGIQRSSGCPSTRATPRSCSSSRMFSSTARSPSGC